MGLYLPFIPSYNPRDWSLDEWEIAIEEDVKKQFIDALEKEQLHRYTLIGLYYYQYEDEYNQIINNLFIKYGWGFLARRNDIYER